MDVEIIFFLLIVLAIIVPLGHGIWVFLAWILRGCQPRRSSQLDPTVSDDRIATARYATLLRSKSLLSAETHSELMDAIAEEYESSTTRDATLLRKQVPEETIQSRTATPSQSASPPVMPQTAMMGGPSAGASAPSNDRPDFEPTPQSPAHHDTIEIRKDWFHSLSAFMSASNIRWGELVGGLLIIGCSTALVMSLWSEIERIPILKFIIFTSITAVFFAVGLLTHHYWKLPATSRAILSIAMLLVPLNLLAFAALSIEGAWVVATELLSVAVLVWLTQLSSKILYPSHPILLTTGLIALSGASLVIGHVPLESEMVLILSGAGLILVYLAFTLLPFGNEVRRQSQAGSISMRNLLFPLGVFSFSCALPFGLLISQWKNTEDAFRMMTPHLCAVAIPAVLQGLYLWSQAARQKRAPEAMVGASLTCIAAALMLVGTLLAWPVPARLLPTLLVNAAALAAVAKISRHPAAHSGIAVCVSAAWVIFFYLLRGDIYWTLEHSETLIHLFLTTTTAKLLMIPVVGCGLVSFLLSRKRTHYAARTYATTAAAVGVISVTLATIYGFAIPEDPHKVTWLYLMYAIGILSVAHRIRSPLPTLCGGFLLLSAAYQFWAYVHPMTVFPGPFALLSTATLFAVVSIVLRQSKYPERVQSSVSVPLVWLTLASSLGALLQLSYLVNPETVYTYAMYAGWIAGLWGIIAIFNSWPSIFAASQFAATGAGCAWIWSKLIDQPWYAEATSPWFHPSFWQAHLLIIASFGLLWELTRIASILIERRRKDTNPKQADDVPEQQIAPTRQVLLFPIFPPADRILSFGATLAFIVLCVWSVIPDLASTHGITVSAHYNEFTVGRVAWIIFSILVLVHLCAVFSAAHPLHVFSILILIAGSTLMIASLMEQPHEVIHVGRALLAGLFLSISLVLAIQHRWTAKLTASLSHASGSANSTPQWLYTGLVGTLAVPALLLSLTSMGVMLRSSAMIPVWSDVLLRLALIAPIAMIVLSLLCLQVRMVHSAYSHFAAAITTAFVLGSELVLQSRVPFTPMTTFDWMWLIQLNAIATGLMILIWTTVHEIFKKSKGDSRYPRWHYWGTQFSLSAIFVIAGFYIWVDPIRLGPPVAAAGSAWSMLAVLLMGLATWLLRRGVQTMWALSWNSLILLLLFTGIVSYYDSGNWLAFHVLSIGLVVAPVWLIYRGEMNARRSLGPDWSESPRAAVLAQSDVHTLINQNLTCHQCGYNLRGLNRAATCPECNTTISESIQKSVDRLTPQWAGNLKKIRYNTVSASLVYIGVATLFALRSASDDPQSPWWSVGLLTGSSILCLMLAAWAPRRVLAYVAGLLTCLGAGIGYYIKVIEVYITSDEAALCNIAQVIVMAWVLTGAVWLWIERRFLSRLEGDADTSRASAYHLWSAPIAAALILCIAICTVPNSTLQTRMDEISVTSWLAVCVVAGYLIICLSNRTRRVIPYCLYAIGLAAVMHATVSMTASSRSLPALIAITTAGYALTVSLAHRIAARRFITLSEDHSISHALWHCHMVLLSVGTVVAFWQSGSQLASIHRLWLAAAPLLGCGALLLLKTPAPRTAKTTYALLLAWSAATLAAWSQMPLAVHLMSLNRLAGMLTTCVIFLVLSSLLRRMSPLSKPWLDSLKQSNAVATGLGIFAGLAMSLLEIRGLMQNIPFSMTPLWGNVIIVSLAAMIALCFLFAIKPNFDPLQCHPRLRDIYVYVAEILMGMLALHIRACKPELFHGFMSQFWPALVLGLAIAAVVAGEFCRRMKLDVVKTPLINTAIILPLFNTPEVFISASRMDYSLVLLLDGVFYASLAAMWRSKLLGIFAALALNGGLWYFLHGTPGLGFTRHPQLWTVPLTLALLAASHFNRNIFTANQGRILHYVCLLIIYLSSAGDMFLVGVAKAPWLPLVLMVFSVAGVLVGLAWRLRSFLILGTGFLCLSMLTVIWHAATNLGWTWVWYAAGITLGAIIITFFALLEKKRDRMTGWIENVKAWSD